ncbi:MAG: D-alanyl-D-alanine carboxypeptidase family protein [Pseudomonadota bacterium]
MFRLFLGLVFIVSLALGARAHGQGFESEASHAVIMDHASGEILWEKNGAEPMIPASMTKMMTAFVVFERVRTGEIALTDQFTVSENAWRKGGWSSGGSTMGLAIGDQPTVEELLRGVIILSGNDACIVLAEGISGTEEAFAREMTALAQRMGLSTASFRNATGLDEDGHRISAIDLAVLAQLSIEEFPEFYAFYAEDAYEWRGIRQANRNPLLGRMDGVDGLKTGHLSVSGYGLTASAERAGERRIIVLNGMETEGDRAREAERLMRLAFTAFETRYLKPADLELPPLPVWMGTASTVGVELAEPILIGGAKRDFALGKVELVYQGPLEAPVVAGDPIGQLVITLPDRDPVATDLVATEDVAKTDFVGRVLDGLNRVITGGESS